MLTRILLLLCVALNAPLASAKETLHIYAASSMTNAVNALVADYSQQHDVKLVTVYGGSSSLARQIEAGAPADLFISARRVGELLSRERLSETEQGGDVGGE